MINWKFNPDDYSDSYQLIEPGIYRVKIEKAEEMVSKKSGKTMIRLGLKVTGYSAVLYHYTVLDDSNEEAIRRTNSNLGSIFDSFGITAGNFNLDSWIGKMGAADITNKLDDREVMRNSVRWFISRSKQDNLSVVCPF